MHGPGSDHDRPLVVCVVGTRPEVVKMAPVVAALRRVGGIATRLVTTGQHRGLLDQALADFGLVPDLDLALMHPGQGLAGATGRALIALAETLADLGPDLVLAQGDTTTVLATALASHYGQIPFGHVEAGLRTGSPYRPFPEEKNRVVASHLATLHFAPTGTARDNLVREGIEPSTIVVTGNTVIDALRLAADRPIPSATRATASRYVLMTVHRRESFGAPLRAICAAVLDVVRARDDVGFVIPVHPNPAVTAVVHEALGGLDRVRLIGTQGYLDFLALIRGAALVLSDSGGVQEEAPALGKRVFVLRDETERPEAVAAGMVRLVGTDRDAIRAAVLDFLDEPESGRPPAGFVNPYGDGHAADRIAAVVARHLGVDPGPLPAGVGPTWSPSDARL